MTQTSTAQSQATRIGHIATSVAQFALIALTSLTVTAISLLFIAEANAFVEAAPGTFVATQCGEQANAGIKIALEDGEVRRVCWGAIVNPQIAADSQLALSAAEVKLESGETAQFVVVDRQPLLVAMQGGMHQERITLQAAQPGLPAPAQIVMRAVVNRDGTVHSVRGELNGRQFFVGNFQFVHVLF